MKTFLLVVMSVIVSVNAYANGNWVYIGANMSGDEYFIDKNSMQTSGDSKTFWFLANYGQRSKWGDMSHKIQRTINCRTREIIARYMMTYDDINSTGKLTLSFDPKGSWEPIAPDTSYWRLLEHVCK